jgi:hypothetical protein
MKSGPVHHNCSVFYGAARKGLSGAERFWREAPQLKRPQCQGSLSDQYFPKNGLGVDNWRLGVRPFMDKAIEECVEALKDVRRSLHNDTDPSIGLALDAVIVRFESHLDKASIDEADVALTAAEALMIISAFLSCCTSVVDLMERL